MKCDICGRQPVTGNRVSHSKRHTRRRWLPNVHRTTLYLEGMEFSVHMCTRCMRNQHKAAK